MREGDIGEKGIVGEGDRREKKIEDGKGDRGGKGDSGGGR